MQVDVRVVGSIPGSGRSPGRRRGNPLQYSGDRGAGGLQSIGSQRAGHDTTEATWHTKNAKQRPVALAKAVDVDMYRAASGSRKADGFRLLSFSIS